MSSDGPYLLAVISLAETERSRGAALAPLVTSILDRHGITRLRLVVGRTTDREDPVAEAEDEIFPSLHDRAALDHALADPAGRRILHASLSELAKGTEVRVAFPGAGETLVMQIANRAITFGADGRVLHDVRVGAR